MFCEPSNYVLYKEGVDKNDLTKKFGEIVKRNLKESNPPTILCIGTDRSTGDSLGPWVGTMLKEKGYPGKVFGTIHNPVHAANLEEVLKSNNNFEREIVIAVDACLGSENNIGRIYCGKGGLKPGSGINKDLPLVGDFYIKAVVNVGGFMEFLALQNTRLSLVVSMAEIITKALMETFASKEIA